MHETSGISSSNTLQFATLARKSPPDLSQSAASTRYITVTTTANSVGLWASLPALVGRACLDAHWESMAATHLFTLEI